MMFKKLGPDFKEGLSTEENPTSLLSPEELTSLQQELLAKANQFAKQAPMIVQESELLKKAKDTETGEFVQLLEFIKNQRQKAKKVSSSSQSNMNVKMKSYDNAKNLNKATPVTKKGKQVNKAA